MPAFTIGEVAKAAGVGVETVRFYERKGLIPDPSRRPSGYRAYPEAVVERIVFIRHAKELGFSLKEIGDLLSLRVARNANCARVKRRTEDKIRDLESKIRRLQRWRRTLRKLAEACDEGTPTSECAILGAIERGGSR